jgi:hypothetical protein
MESLYRKWIRGSRSSMLNVRAGVQPSYSHDYISAAVPLLEAFNPSKEEVVNSATANQLLKLIPACDLNIQRGFRMQMEVNPTLHEYALVSYNTLLEPGDKPVVMAKFHRSMEFDQLDWLVRFYLVE